MEPAPVPAPSPGEAVGFPLTSPAHAFQLKWDGVRMLAFLADGRVRLQNRRLRDRTATYPELSALSGALRARQAILDGEVVVLREGRPCFPLVLRREQAAGAEAAARLASVLPAAFAAFDLLYLDGADLTGRPWWARQELLSNRLDSRGAVVRLTGSTDDGPALWDAVVSRGLEGVVAKDRASPYVPGRGSRHWLKVKPRRRLDCVVGGYTRSGGRVGALLLGLYGAAGALPTQRAGLTRATRAEAGLIYVGRVGTGFTEELRLGLAGHLPNLEMPRPAFANPPRLPGPDVRWVAPLLTVTVEFAEWTEDLKLRAPSLAGFSRAEPEACRL